jgi:hypothetical protein
LPLGTSFDTASGGPLASWILLAKRNVSASQLLLSKRGSYHRRSRDDWIGLEAIVSSDYVASRECGSPVSDADVTASFVGEASTTISVNQTAEMD